MYRRIYYNSMGEVQSSIVHDNLGLIQSIVDEASMGRIDERSIESVTIRHKNGETFVHIVEQ